MDPMLVKIVNSYLFLSILEPKENHLQAIWPWENPFTFLSLCFIIQIWQLTISRANYCIGLLGE